LSRIKQEIKGEVIESCPELADLDNPLDAAQRMLTDLDSLDIL
jgi:hypothetical protein